MGHGELVDDGTRRFIAELVALRDGHAKASGEVRVVTYSRRVPPDGWVLPDIALQLLHAAASAFRNRDDREWFAAVFDVRARRGDRALLTVPVEPSAGLEVVPDGTSATLYGVLEPGRAVALAIHDELYLPVGPATRPGLRTPRCRWR